VYFDLLIITMDGYPILIGFRRQLDLTPGLDTFLLIGGLLPETIR
jgi:hypothetical protein